MKTSGTWTKSARIRIGREITTGQLKICGKIVKALINMFKIFSCASIGEPDALGKVARATFGAGTLKWRISIKLRRQCIAERQNKGERGR